MLVAATPTTLLRSSPWIGSLLRAEDAPDDMLYAVCGGVCTAPCMPTSVCSLLTRALATHSHSVSAVDVTNALKCETPYSTELRRGDTDDDVFDEHKAVPTILSMMRGKTPANYYGAVRYKDNSDDDDDDDSDDDDSDDTDSSSSADADSSSVAVYSDDDDGAVVVTRCAMKQPRFPLARKQPRKRPVLPAKQPRAQKRQLPLSAAGSPVSAEQTARKSHPSLFNQDDDACSSLPPRKRRGTTPAMPKNVVRRSNAEVSLPSLRSLLVQLTDWSGLSVRLADAATKRYVHPFFADESVILVVYGTRGFVFSHATHGYYGELGHPLTFRTWPTSVLVYEDVVRNAQRVTDYFYKIPHAARSPLPQCTAHQRNTKTDCCCLWQLYNAYCVSNGQCECVTTLDHSANSFRCYNTETDFVPHIANNEVFYTFARNRRMKSQNSAMARNYHKIRLPQSCVYELEGRNGNNRAVRTDLVRALKTTDRDARETILARYRKRARREEEQDSE